MNERPSGRIVVGWIPDFPVIAAGTEGAETVAVVHRDEVVACSAAARAAGVRRRVRVAQYRCARLRVVERDLAAGSMAGLVLGGEGGQMRGQMEPCP